MKNNTTPKRTRPVYTHETVTYTFAGKWQFTKIKKEGEKDFSLRTWVNGGVETAHKVARIIAGALKRTNGEGLDALARGHIWKINQKAKAEAEAAA